MTVVLVGVETWVTGGKGQVLCITSSFLNIKTHSHTRKKFTHFYNLRGGEGGSKFLQW